MLTKRDVYEAIEECPGATSAELARWLGIKIAAAESHTRILRVEGFIESQTAGGHKGAAEWVVIRAMPPEQEYIHRIIPARGAPALKGLGPSCVWDLGAR